MAITSSQKYLLNRMNATSYKVGLGDLIEGAESSAPGSIALTDTYLLVGNGSNVAAGVAMSGDATITNAGVVAIGAGKVVEAMLAVPASDGLNSKRVARATYDFSVDGGAVGDIVLGVTLPDNAVVIRSYLEVIAGMTSAGNAGTIAIKTEGAGDVLAAVDADTISGFVECIQDGTAANFIKMSAAKEITATVAVEDLTAGKFIVFIEYVVSD